MYYILLYLMRNRLNSFYKTNDIKGVKMKIKFLLFSFLFFFISSVAFSNQKKFVSAVKNNEIEVVKKLIGSIEIDLKDRFGYPPIFWAVSKDHFDIVKLLIDKNANFVAKEKYGDTLLHLAVRKNNYKIIDLLLSKKMDINIKDRYRTTPLHRAVKSKNEKMVTYLLSKGADPNIRDRSNETTLHSAATYGVLGILKKLVAKKANILAKDRKGNIPIIIAASRKKKDIVEYLLSKTSNIMNYKEGYYDNTLLHYACKNGWEDIVQKLLEKKADVEVENKKGDRPLHFAIIGGSVEIVKWLLAKKAKVNATNKRGYTPLFFVGSKNGIQIAKLLLKHGANIGYKSKKNKNTPLHYIIWNYNIPLVEFLIKKGANVNAINDKHWTPLHVAIAAKNLGMIKILLKNGAQINIKNRYNFTPLHLAATKGVLEIIETLLLNGADKNIVTQAGKTASMMAKNKEVRDFIRDFGKVSIGDQKQVLLEVEKIKIKEIFSSIYKFYAHHSIGYVTLANKSEEHINEVSVRFFVKKLMDFETESKVFKNFKKGTRLNIKLSAVFNNKVLRVTEDTPYNARIKIKYKVGKKVYVLTKTQKFNLYNKNAISWDNAFKITSFITHKDHAVKPFSRQVINFFKDKSSFQINENLRYAMQLFNAMSALGINYVTDPKTPYASYSKKGSVVDYVQYPREILRLKNGDCDDLTVLYSALLENLGIDTALLTYPGHIFLMFNTEMPAVKAEDMAAKDKVVIYKNQVWVPVEITLVGNSFSVAWKKGAADYHKYDKKDKIDIYEVKKGWHNFPPVSLEYSTWEPDHPKRKKIVSLVKKDEQNIKINQLENKIKKYEQKLKVSRKKYILYNKIGVVYARFGLYQTAVNFFNKAIKKRKNYFSGYNNIGNIYLLEKNYKKALSFYLKAKKIRPKSALLRLNLAIVYKLLNNTKSFNKEFEKLVRLNKNLSEQYSYLLKANISRSSDKNSEQYKNIIWH